MPPIVVAGAAGAIIAMAAGAMIQRGSIAKDDIRAAGAVQNVGGLGVALAATLLQNDYRWDNSPRSDSPSPGRS